MTTTFEKIQSELPFENLKENEDVRLELVGNEIRVYPVSEHATQYIGKGEYLGFTNA